MGVRRKDVLDVVIEDLVGDSYENEIIKYLKREKKRLFAIEWYKGFITAIVFTLIYYSYTKRKQEREAKKEAKKSKRA